MSNAVSLASLSGRVMKEVATFHSNWNGGVPINYPNRFKIDVEHRTEPFITVELVPSVDPAELGHDPGTYVSGSLMLNFNMIVGSGTMRAYEFLDAVSEDLAGRTVEGVTYGVADPIPISLYPEWKGLAIKIDIQTTVDFQISCS